MHGVRIVVVVAERRSARVEMRRFEAYKWGGGQDTHANLVRGKRRRLIGAY
jgi:hypothetical protein